MSALKQVLWGFLAVLGAVALAFVTGFVNPQEKVNGLWLVVVAGCIQPALFMAVRREIEKSPARQARGAVRKGGILETGC